MTDTLSGRPAALSEPVACDAALARLPVTDGCTASGLTLKITTTAAREDLH